MAPDAAMTYSVTGQPVHLAARMQQLAMPGTILMAATDLSPDAGLPRNQGARPHGGEGTDGARRDLRAARGHRLEVEAPGCRSPWTDPLR